MTSPNLFTNSAAATPHMTVNANPEGAAQTEGQTLYQQASSSCHPEVVVKRQFEPRNQDQKTQLANEFIASAGREGINDLAATPDGQHALAVVYQHAGGEVRDLVRQVHEEQGNTAVDYSGQQDNNLDDPLGVSDAGVKIGPQINGFQYTAMTAGVAYGLAENTVMGLVDMGKTVCRESEALKTVDNLEFLDIDSTGQKSESPGLSLPSWEDIGAGLKRNIQATNQALATAKQQGSYFAAGKAISNDPLLQMTGLGDMAVFGSLARMQKLAKLESLATDTPRKLGGGAEAAGDGKLSSIDGNKVREADGGVGANSLSDASVRSEIVGPNNSATMQVGNTATGNRALFSSSELAGVERASPDLLSSVGQKRAISFAEEGSDALRFLDYRKAEAAAFGAEDIVLRTNPSKAAVLEEFLHGTQQKLGIIDDIGRAASETHVKDFMIRHQKLLGLGEEDVKRLQILKDMGL